MVTVVRLDRTVARAVALCASGAIAAAKAGRDQLPTMEGPSEIVARARDFEAYMMGDGEEEAG